MMAQLGRIPQSVLRGVDRDDCPVRYLANLMTELKSTATSPSPMPRKPPTPTTTAATLPSVVRIASLTSPSFSLAVFTTVAPINSLALISSPWAVYHWGWVFSAGAVAAGGLVAGGSP